MILKTMRDSFIEQIHARMKDDDKLVFITADFGAPVLDSIRRDYPDRFFNVGIAEQNLINIATGMALEGFTVFAYAISAFITMRCYEQIRVNLAITSQLKEVNVNLIGVGAGISYDVSGPSHHCLEDIAIMSNLPNMEIISPGDYVSAADFINYAFENKKPKYFRFDSKALPAIYEKGSIDIKKGFHELVKGKDVCVITTAYMTQKFKKINEDEFNNQIGHIDLFLLKPLNVNHLLDSIKNYKHVITIEEAFIDYGGINKIISDLMLENKLSIKFSKLGFKDKYNFEIGDREYIHSLNGLSVQQIVSFIKES